MKSQDIRQRFFDFFRSKEHQIIPSAPIVVKDDPSLMFTNAGMNPFKDIFLGGTAPKYSRVANTQKCLRVSGKHNDLEEVGRDTYHHTMFEMLGNWSFGDYFKKEAIHFAWELLTLEYKIPADSLYVTVFQGDATDGTSKDTEAEAVWREVLPQQSHLLYGDKKDNFWEMGETGPCGPCSEIHVDIRSPEEKRTVPGSTLVNKDHPLVVELWNLVFIEFNRKAGGRLEGLPRKHVDTGMGFERLAMVLQGKQSNYDTDIFEPLIRKVSHLSGKPYGNDAPTDIAIRVISDHVRAIAFSISDGQLPSNVKAGYVIRRILRRAVRYGYTFLGQTRPFLYQLVPLLVSQMGSVFPQLPRQESFISKVIKEEEEAFLRTLSTGISMLRKLMENSPQKAISGRDAFVLYDTYGFPFDLTRLILAEEGFSVDPASFQKELEQKKSRSRDASAMDTGDWQQVHPAAASTKFVGYDHMESTVKVMKYRQVSTKKSQLYHLVLDKTPFYAEAGGQTGDTGLLIQEEGKVPVVNTIIENHVHIHVCRALPKDLSRELIARVDHSQRRSTAGNHSATHLLHHALREVLGSHAEQKGSLVHPDYLRFDFSHYEKVGQEDLRKVERLVNRNIRANIHQEEHRQTSMEEARKMGAIAFFGEKYGDQVRVVRFGDSIELCGGTHVPFTGQIGFFKITGETAVAAGIRRIEAITGEQAEEWVYRQNHTLQTLKGLLRNPKDPVKGAQTLIDQHSRMEKELETMKKKQVDHYARDLKEKAIRVNDIPFISSIVSMDSGMVKDLAFRLKDLIPDAFLLLGATDPSSGKVLLTAMVSPWLQKEKGLHAGSIVKELAKEIKGGGGGQPYFATAGGKDAQGLPKAMEKGRKMLEDC